jgi:hypothetical protein
MPRPVAVASGPTDWNEARDIISFGFPEQVGNMTWSIPFVFFTGQSLLHK